MMAFVNLKNNLLSEYPFSYEIVKDDDEDAVLSLFLFEKDKYTDAHVTIPSFVNGIPVKIIDEAAFASSNIESITLPEHLTTIRRRAFHNCQKLKEISIPDSVKYISPYTFSYCLSLENVRWSNQLTAIKEFTFFKNTNLKNVTNIDNVEIIERDAFSSSGIVSFKIPNNCLSIEKEAFRDCFNLKYVYVPPKLKYIKEKAFMNSTNVRLDCSGNETMKEWACENNVKLYKLELTNFLKDLNNEKERGE